MKFSACVELLFAPESTNFPERIRLAKAAGFGAVEFWRWQTKDLDAVERALTSTGTTLTGIVAEPMVGLNDPTQHEAFLSGLRDSIAVAKRLGAKVLIAQAGNELPNLSRERQYEPIVDVLRSAAGTLADTGVTLALEPLNTLVDHPGYLLDSTVAGLDIIEKVDAPSVRLLYDVYHSVAMGEKPEEVLQDRVGLVRHVHLADYPGRHEPGSGQMPWVEHLAWLQASGYDGYVGLEYTPTADTVGSLATLRAHFDLG